MSGVKYRVVKVPDTRAWKLQSHMLLAQVLLPEGTNYQDFIHPRRGSAPYDASCNALLHRDIHDVYPDAVLEEQR